MKSVFKKVFVIFTVSLMLIVFSGCDEKEPLITSGEFPIILEYEYEGQTYIIEDIVVCTYKKIVYDSGGPRGSRWYSSSLKNNSSTVILQFEENTESLMVPGQINKKSYIILDCGQGGYYLGDPEDTDRGPYIFYQELHQVYSSGGTRIEQTKLTNQQLQEIFGIKIIRFEFGSPIENTFE